jgi:hypothetical protein
MAMQLIKITTTIKKGELDARPVYTEGKALKFIALPVDPLGKVALTSGSISFKGCFGNDPFFNVLDYTGKVVKISTRVDPSIPHIPNYLDAAPALLPIQDPGLFEGIQVLVPILDRAETEDRDIILYFG